MTKVKILSADFPDILERMINEFVVKRLVSNIEFSTAGGGGFNNPVIYSAMVIYEGN